MQADGSSEQIKGTYLTQISEDGELAVLSGSNQYSVSDKVIRGGVKIQKRDLETKDTKAQGSATLQYTEFNIISLNDIPVLVEGKLYNKNGTVKKIQTGIDGIASTSADLLPYGNYRLEESKAPEGYLTDGAKAIDFSITEDGKIVDLTDKSHSVYNHIKRGDIEGVKIGAGTHKTPCRCSIQNYKQDNGRIPYCSHGQKRSVLHCFKLGFPQGQYQCRKIQWRVVYVWYV